MDPLAPAPPVTPGPPQPLSRRACRGVALLDGLAAIYAWLTSASHSLALLLPSVLRAPGAFGHRYCTLALVFGATSMAMSAFMLLASAWFIFDGTRKNDPRVRIGLLLAIGGVPGPVGLLWSMHVHREPWPPLLSNGAGTLALLILNALPLALWWRQLGRWPTSAAPPPA